MGSDGLEGVSTQQTARPTGSGIGPIVDWVGKLKAEMIKLLKDPYTWASGIIMFFVGLLIGYIWGRVSKKLKKKK